MKALLIIWMSVAFHCSSWAQEKTQRKEIGNVRVSALLFPAPTLLLTAEFSIARKFTLQLESNFVHTSGANFKYFLRASMQRSYVFTGIAFVENRLLRKDEKITFLPYIGWGYAHRWGRNKRWTFDTRIGLGSTTNADLNAIYPILKTGIGRIF